MVGGHVLVVYGSRFAGIISARDVLSVLTEVATT